MIIDTSSSYPSILPDLSTQVIEGLLAKGYAVIPDAFPSLIIDSLRQELLSLESEGILTPAAIGRREDNQLNHTIRRDKTHWLEGSSLAQQQFLSVMDELKLALNRELFLGLAAFEAHYALYPEDAFYRTHLDSFKGAKNRVVSVVVYLNEEWQERDGGELQLYAPENSDNILATIPPRGDTCVVFLSEEIPHEVLPTLKPRMSIAGWFHCRNENPLAGLK